MSWRDSSGKRASRLAAIQLLNEHWRLSLLIPSESDGPSMKVISDPRSASKQEILRKGTTVCVLEFLI
jgi:hypothetical protein